MEQLKHMKDTLVSCIQAQMSHLDTVDAKELGEVVDMVKDIEEAIYYCTITKAMEEKEKNGNGDHHHYYTQNYYTRDMDRSNGRMYYDEMPMDYNKMYYNGNSSSGNNGGNSGNGSSRNYSNGGNGNSYVPGDHNSSTRHYSELEYPMMRDSREGRSPMSRKSYMESKEMHQPKTTQMKELEKYLQELSSDIVEMIQDASPEEKAFMEKKIAALAAKVNP